ncbi:ATP-grasp domain-containing protein [Streptomyces sp. NPDC001393]
MSAPRVLVLGGKAGILRKAADLGLDVVNIQKPSAFDPAAVAYCTQIHLMDYQDIPAVTALAEALHATSPFSRVLTQTEAAQVVAGHLTTRLGLPGNGDEITRALHDKRALRELLNARGLGPVAVERGTDRSALRDFVRRHGAAVVKPTMGSGSLGVRLIHSAEEADAAWDWLESFGLKDFMVEELLTGTELSVETFSCAGDHTVLAVTGKDTGGGVVELGHVVPARISPEQADSVAEFTCQVLDAVGLVDGTAHTEIMLTGQGPRVIESHARRGGDRINDLVEIACGVDMEQLAYRQALPGFRTPGISGAGCAAAIRFLTAEPGRVVAVEGIEEARSLDGVLDVRIQVEPGDTVRPLHWSEDRCGQILVRAEDSERAEALARRAAGLITIRTVPQGQDAAVDEPLTLGRLLAEVDEVLDPFAAAHAH